MKVLKIPSSTYYGYCHWQPSQTACRRQLIKRQLLTIWLKYPMYGYPRLTLALKQIANLKVGQKLVYRLMQELGIKSRMLKKTNKPQTHTDYEQRPNLIKQLADQTGVLLTDITYIPVKHDWIYLASIYNPKTRQVVAYKIHEQMTKELATAPVKMILNRDTLPSIIHSDMGSQYTSELFENTLLAAGIKHSYSHKGCPGDNARIESFHSILKREYVNFQNFQNSYEAIAGLDQYIRWYNGDRISLVA
ncbi:Mobile element protein [Lactiplantibacillus plantarum]|nr:Mobile element protein [Lactiplantibacillus plantarum]